MCLVIPVIAAVNFVPVIIFVAVAICFVMVSESNQAKVYVLVSTGGTDRAGDVDPLEAGRGCHHFPDVATPATPGHPADTHPKHGQHFQFHDGNSAHLCRGSQESGQWHFTSQAAFPSNQALRGQQCRAACEQVSLITLISYFFSLFFFPHAEGCARA